jgi:hypothetical protein
LETEFDVQKARKRAQKKSRPDEEKHGERHLGHDKGVTKSLPAATVSPAAADPNAAGIELDKIMLRSITSSSTSRTGARPGSSQFVAQAV